MKRSKRIDYYQIEFTDLKTYQLVEKKELKIINRFFLTNKEEKEKFLRFTDKIISFRDKILKSGFSEAKYNFKQFNFYRRTNANVAFIVNLEDLGDYIDITYGFTTISDNTFLEEHGEDNDTIKIRFHNIFKEDKDEEYIVNKISEIFHLHCSKTKDEIIDFKKERQKEFLNKINDKLRTLNFKRKNSKWSRMLESDYCLEFYAQKSQWSDQYYFNITIYNSKLQNSCCYNLRLNTNNKGIYNWQLLSFDEFEDLMNDAINNIILPIINTPLIDLGAKKEICMGCWIKNKI